MRSVMVADIAAKRGCAQTPQACNTTVVMSIVAKEPAVYILASKRNGTLYIGVTSNLVQRAWQHKNGITGGFAQRYGVHRLVYYEMADDMTSAITREKQLKKWRRAWKIELIEKSNANWDDLWTTILP
jgi:putative endonuclease